MPHTPRNTKQNFNPRRRGKRRQIMADDGWTHVTHGYMRSTRFEDVQAHEPSGNSPAESLANSMVSGKSASDKSEYESASDDDETQHPEPLHRFTLTKLAMMSANGQLDDEYIELLKLPGPGKYPVRKARDTVDGLVENYDSTMGSWLERYEHQGLIKVFEEFIPLEVCQKISKSVCFGLGSLSNKRGYDLENRSMMQFVAWMDIVNIIKNITGEPISLIAQEPDFNQVDKSFLKQHDVTILETPDAFGEIDDSTFFLWLFIPFHEAFPEIYSGTAPLSLQNSPLNKCMLREVPERPLLQETLDRLNLEEGSKHLPRFQKELNRGSDHAKYLTEFHSTPFPNRASKVSEVNIEFEGLEFFWKPPATSEANEGEE